jgi:hypothetical protein
MSRVKELNLALGMSFRYASAPAGMKGSFLLQIASKGGFDLRKYSWNFGSSFTFEA